MPVHLEEHAEGRILELLVSGKLDREDYNTFVPRVERLIRQHGRISVLLQMHDFHGWTAGALWEDLKFDLRHFRDIERLALVGEKRWQKSMSVFCKPFTTAQIRYYEHARVEDARAWLCQEDHSTSQEDDFTERTKKRLSELQGKMKELEAKVVSQSTEAKAEFRELRESFEGKLKIARAKLAESPVGEASRSIKQAAESTVKQLEKGYEKAVERFGSTSKQK